MAKFLIKQTATGFRFDLKAGNGESIATSEVYDTRAACLKGIRSMIACSQGSVEDHTVQPVIRIKNPKYEMTIDKNGKFRFRLKAKNGKVVAVSESYTTKASCENGIASVKQNAPEAELEE